MDTTTNQTEEGHEDCPWCADKATTEAPKATTQRQVRLTVDPREFNRKGYLR